MAELITRIEGQGPDLFFIHGWGINSTAFDTVVPYFLPKFRVHLIDLPGYGDNLDAFASYSDLQALLKGLHQVIPQNAHLVGWSLGGIVAMAYACAFPNSIKSFITVCSSPRFCEELDDLDQHNQIWPGVEYRILKAFTRLVKPKNKDEVCDHFLGMQALGSPSIRHDIRALRKALAAGPKPTYEALRFGLDLLAQLDLRTDCRKIKVPSLHIFGRNDRIISADIASFWNELPSAETAIFDKTAHNPFLSNPNLFSQTIEDFIKKFH